MQSANLPAQFTVDVFNDHSPSDASPWSRIGGFISLNDAISACKKIVDEFLNIHCLTSSSAEALAFHYLSYGPVPCINGVENLGSFDVYRFLDQRCLELTQ